MKIVHGCGSVMIELQLRDVLNDTLSSPLRSVCTEVKSESLKLAFVFTFARCEWTIKFTKLPVLDSVHVHLM